ncbi:MAG: YiiD C-terminal domain-containing protein [Pseudomonadota bacterium]
MRKEAPVEQAAHLLQRMRAEIPLTAAMQLAVAAFDGETLVLAAPLAPNINDKGSAFAGSITALGSITGWSLLTLWSEREDQPCQVAIYEARFVFRKPLSGDFTASVSLPDAAARAALLESLQRKGKGRVALRVVLADATGEAAFLEADYALWRA